MAKAFGLKQIYLKNRFGNQILVYHGIDNYGNTSFNSKFISTERFENDIAYLSANFNVLSLEAFLNAEFDKQSMNIAITFDDGFLNNYTNALPILKKYSVPATFFITTIQEEFDFLWADFVDLVSSKTNKEIILNDITFTKKGKRCYYSKKLKKTLKAYCIGIPFSEIKQLFKLFEDEWKEVCKDQNLNDYWELMTIDHLKEIVSDDLFSIGSHSQYHSNFSILNEEEAIKELQYSKMFLEKNIGQKITCFAPPYGVINSKAIALAKKYGYEHVLAASDTSYENKVWNRLQVNPYISTDEQMAFLLKGSYFL